MKTKKTQKTTASRRRASRLVALAAAALLLPASAALAQSGDKIIQKTGQVLGERPPITITDETFLVIKYKVSSAEQQVALSKVESVVHGDEPEEYRNARTALGDGDLQGALELFQETAAMTDPAWVKQYALYNVGVCLQGLGKFPEAIAAYKNLQSKAPTSRFIPDSMLEIGKCHLMSGNVAAAKEAFSEVQDAVRAKGFDPLWGHWAQYWLARIMERDKAFGEALTEYNRIQGLVEKDHPRLANECRMRVGNVYIQQKDIGKARQFFKDIADSEDGTGLEAGARLGLGECAYEEKKLDEARYNFLWAVTLAKRLAEGVVDPDTAAKSMYYAGLCFEVMKDNERNPLRARELYRGILDDYATTEWAPRAKERLGR
jgi:TolA-binding protein